MPCGIVGQMRMPVTAVFVSAKDASFCVDQCEVRDGRKRVAVRLDEKVFPDLQTDFAVILTVAENKKVHVVGIGCECSPCIGQDVVNALHGQ